MAEKKNVNQKEEKVPYCYPLSQNPQEEKTVFGAVNGKTIRIMRGKTVMIPKSFAEVFDNAQAGEQKMIELASAMQDDFIERVQKFVM